MGRSARAAIPDLIDATKKNADYQVRKATIKALAVFGPEAKDAVPFLMDSMKDPELRMVAVQTLAKMGAEAKPAVKIFGKGLFDDNRDSCYQYLQALGQLGPEARDAVPDLVRLLKNGDAALRPKALDVIGRIGPGAEAALPVLNHITEDGDRQTRHDAQLALWKIGGSVRNVTFLDLYSIRLASSDASTRLAALDGLCSSSGQLDIRIIFEVVQKHPDGPDARVARQTLIQICKGILPLLRESNSGIRLSAVKILAQLAPEAELAVPPLIVALEDPDRNVRQAAFVALGQGGPTAAKAIPALIRILKHADKDMRSNAAWSLGLIGQDAKSAVPALIDALQDNERAASG
jgi:HEAT repeat protein